MQVELEAAAVKQMPPNTARLIDLSKELQANATQYVDILENDDVLGALTAELTDYLKANDFERVLNVTDEFKAVFEKLQQQANVTVEESASLDSEIEAEFYTIVEAFQAKLNDSEKIAAIEERLAGIIANKTETLVNMDQVNTVFQRINELA